MLRRTVLAAVAGAACGAAWGQCQESWSDVFTPAAFDGQVEALSVYNDGSGALLIALGEFTRDGGEPREHLAAWDGSAWATFPSPEWPPGSGGVMRSDASHSRLLVAWFNRTLYIREAGAWRAVSLSVLGASTNDIEFAADGSSDDVYLAGWYWMGSEDFAPVLHWDGQEWTRMGHIYGSYAVDDIAWFNDGNGPRLYAAGARTLDGALVDDLAVWNGASWEAVALGRASRPMRLAVWDDGNGQALFTTDRYRIGRWDGAAWIETTLEPEASGVAGFQAIELWGKPRLVWASDFAAGRTRLWHWDGAGAEVIPGEIEGTVEKLDGAGVLGDGLFASGDFVRAGGADASNVAMFDGEAWSDVSSSESGNGAPDARIAVSVGPEFGPLLGGRVYVGDMRFAGGEWARSLASWDGRAWSYLAPVEFEAFAAHALLLGDMGEGPRLLAAGTIGEQFLERSVAAWDGEQWSMLPPANPSSSIYTMAIGDVNGARQLFIGGRFEWLGSEVANYVGSFDGTAWHTLRDGVNDWVWSSIVFDDGTGPALYVGGEFTEADGKPASAIARWDEAGWHPVGDGFSRDGGFGPLVYALASADLGDGPRLYAAGRFDSSGATPLGNIAVWSGSAWAPLGPGLESSVLGLALIDTAEGLRLAAAGAGMHLWDGSSWSEFADANGAVYSIAQSAHEDGAIYIAGGFTEVGGVPSEGIARWGCEECAADFDGNGVLDTRDVIAFLNAWSAQDGSADIDGNGMIDTRDVIAFLNAWNAGC